MYSRRADYLYGRKAQLVWGDEVFLLVVGDINHFFGGGVEGFYEFFKADRGRFPCVSAEFFGIYNGLEIFFYSPHLSL